MTSASTQAGFDFSDNTTTIAAEDPPGTWLDSRLTTTQYREHVRTARPRLASLDPVLRLLFTHAVDQIEPRLIEMADTIEDDGSAYPLWGIELNASPEVWDAFVKVFEHGGWPGIETRVRKEAWCCVYAAYVPDVGSIVGRRWSDCYGLSYDVQRDEELRPSYRDNAPLFEVPATAWRHLYVGHLVADCHDGRASVRAFTHQGRSYVIKGTISKGRYIEGQAWSVDALADWRGPTYTYRQLCLAWDEGRKERGDSRGLVVTIGGQACVLNGYARFVDHNDDSWLRDAADGGEATVDDDEHDEACEHEEACDADA